MRFTSTLLAACLATLATALPLQGSPNGQQIAFAAPSLSPSIRSRPDIAAAVAALPLEHAVHLEQFIAELPEVVQVRLGEDEDPITMTEGEKALLTLTGTRFIDVTNEQQILTTAVRGACLPPILRARRR